MNWVQIKFWFSGLPREARQLLIALMLILSVVLGSVVSSIWYSISHNWAEVTVKQPRIARLKGYESAREKISDAAAATSVILEEFAYSAKVDQSQVGAQLQQTLRGFAEESGLTVKGSQLVSGIDEESIPEGFRVLAVDLNMTGVPQALISFLSDVYGHKPVLKVSTLNMAKKRSRRPSRRQQESAALEEQDLNLDLQIIALMVSS